MNSEIFVDGATFVQWKIRSKLAFNCFLRATKYPINRIRHVQLLLRVARLGAQMFMSLSYAAHYFLIYIDRWSAFLFCLI